MNYETEQGFKQFAQLLAVPAVLVGYGVGLHYLTTSIEFTSSFIRFLVVWLPSAMLFFAIAVFVAKVVGKRKKYFVPEWKKEEKYSNKN